MDPLIQSALTIAPELARWLSGGTAAAASTAISQAFLTSTGTTDAAAATAALQRDPNLSGQLRILLAQSAAEFDHADRATALDAVAAAIRDAVGARAPSQRAAATWSAPVISGIVLVTFAAVVTLVVTCGMPSGSETMANMLLGTLAAMATSVVSYWVGSSAGSARKEEQIAQAARTAAAS